MGHPKQIDLESGVCSFEKQSDDSFQASGFNSGPEC